MRAGRPVIITMLLLSAVAGAATSLDPDPAAVYDVPRLERVTIDGRADDWGAGASRLVHLMPLPRAGLETIVRLAWDDRGLLLLARVHDDNWVEHTDLNQLWRHDGLEIFMAPKREAADVCQWVIAPGMAADVDGLRWSFGDYRRTASLKALPAADIQVARVKTDDGRGYLLEARFPWAPLALDAKPGLEFALQIWVNDSDTTSPLSMKWPWHATFYPGTASHENTRKMHTLRLTAPTDDAGERRDQLVNASINGTHAYQVLMAHKQKKGDTDAFSLQGHTPERLRALVTCHRQLLACEPEQVRKWIDGQPSEFDPEKCLNPLLTAPFAFAENLPVTLAIECFKSRRPETVAPSALRALANELQLILEVERDGGEVQQLLKLYREIGLLISPCDLGVADNNDAFEAIALRLGGMACDAPFATREGAWKITLRKLHNWKLFYHGTAAGPFAEDLLEREDVKALLPKVRAMPTFRLFVLGHSLTIPEHWASPAKMQHIVDAVFKKEAPGKVTVQHAGHGSMGVGSSRQFMNRVLAFKPDVVLIVAFLWGEGDWQALKQLTAKLKEAGVQHVAMFDDPMPQPAEPNADVVKRYRDMGIDVIPAADMLRNHPEKHDFISLDGGHPRPSYQKAMAVELLKYLVNVAATE